MTTQPDMIDPENPEWTREDFARALPPEEMPANILAAFPNTKVRGRPALAEAEKKQHVSLRLSPDVLAYYRGKGDKWQGQLNAVLRQIMELETTLEEAGSMDGDRKHDLSKGPKLGWVYFFRDAEYHFVPAGRVTFGAGEDASATPRAGLFVAKQTKGSAARASPVHEKPSQGITGKRQAVVVEPDRPLGMHGSYWPHPKPSTKSKSR